MKKLTKSPDRKMSGVLGGIADYLEVDPTLLRIIFIIVMVFTAVFPCIIIYFVASYIMPEH